MTLKGSDIKEAERKLLDPWWRLNNLYYIIDKAGNKDLFTCNWAQEEIYRNMWYCNIVLKARQLGISTFVCLLFLDRCLFNSNVSGGIICATLEDAQQMFKRIKFAYDSLPASLKDIRMATVDSARELTFNNGSSLRVGTSMRGSTFQYLHISEFGKISAHDPGKAREIVTGSLNTLAAGQYCFIESTAEGREGYFFEMCKHAEALKNSGTKLTKLDYKFFFFPWFRAKEYAIDTPVTIPKELDEYFTSLKDKGIEITDQQKWWYVKKQATQLDDMKREYPATPEESFQTANDGAYYSRYITQARVQSRITNIYHNPEEPVHTAWDLGYGDSTAIWVFQVEGQEIHFLEYIEGNNEPLTHYLKLLKSRDYNYGFHLVPHDAKVHEFGSGLTRVDIARKHGFTFTVVRDLSITEGIDAVRHMFSRFWFDESKCAKGISCLDNYRRTWNTSQGCWGSQPLHNSSSHGADAMRMMAVGFSYLDKAAIDDNDYRRMENYYRPRFTA